MDDLKAEILRKRKEREGDLTNKPSKYLRRGELEKLKQAEKERTASASPAPPTSQTPPISTSSPKPDTTSTSAPGDGEAASSSAPPPAAAAGSSKQEGFNISNEDAVRRLRAKGQPIRLFDESDRDRRLRLRALELLEERGDGNKGAGLNDFRRVMEHMEKGLNVEDAVQRLLNKGQGGANAEGKEGDVKAVVAAAKDDEEQVIDLGLLQTDPDRLYPLIYYAIKRKLKEWEQYMADRPDSIKHSVQGKRAAATQVQSGEYLKPLFKLLRQRNLPPDVLRRIGEIIYYMQQREYQKANDSYLRLSIGNAPWPIGVTMVGIHERSAREKISTDQVAHVLNDEVSRKYIQSLKRLLTFAQTKYPPADISQLMG